MLKFIGSHCCKFSAVECNLVIHKKGGNRKRRDAEWCRRTCWSKPHGDVAIRFIKAHCSADRARLHSWKKPSLISAFSLENNDMHFNNRSNNIHMENISFFTNLFFPLFLLKLTLLFQRRLPCVGMASPAILDMNLKSHFSLPDVTRSFYYESFLVIKKIIFARMLLKLTNSIWKERGHLLDSLWHFVSLDLLPNYFALYKEPNPREFATEAVYKTICRNHVNLNGLSCWNWHRQGHGGRIRGTFQENVSE